MGPYELVKAYTHTPTQWSANVGPLLSISQPSFCSVQFAIQLNEPLHKKKTSLAWEPLIFFSRKCENVLCLCTFFDRQIGNETEQSGEKGQGLT